MTFDFHSRCHCTDWTPVYIQRNFGLPLFAGQNLHQKEQTFRSHDLFQFDHILMLELLQDLDLSYCSDWKLCGPKKIPNCYISTTIMDTSC
jgi:hypothetical protein